MAPSLTTGRSFPESSVSVSCLFSQQIFSGQKCCKGFKGQFRVASRGLSLHLQMNLCKGPCLKHYIQGGHSTKYYSSSIVVVKSHAPVIQSSIPSCSLNHPKTFSMQDTDGHQDSALSFGDDGSVFPRDLRNSRPMSTPPKPPPLQFDGSCIAQTTKLLCLSDNIIVSFRLV